MIRKTEQSKTINRSQRRNADSTEKNFGASVVAWGILSTQLLLQAFKKRLLLLKKGDMWAKNISDSKRSVKLKDACKIADNKQTGFPESKIT
ncbi:hypothetical protein NPIL_86671 [Nephila pilipes]|uniref:Uncharacterized protein n=1 Tax=Nephila pilipes TaxID=299642 RepID=A0A8X6PUA7_NEPPI|nr:hypothetical protein NPIL_86671 [Nephila pilipes]